jgi:ribonuclease P protein component
VRRENRLTLSRDFQRLRRDGAVTYHPLSVLVYAPNPSGISRVAVVASKAVGKAVKRNLVKRRFKSAIQAAFPDIKPGWDMIFYTRSASAASTFQDIASAVARLLQDASLLE